MKSLLLFFLAVISVVSLSSCQKWEPVESSFEVPASFKTFSEEDCKATAKRTGRPYTYNHALKMCFRDGAQ